MGRMLNPDALQQPAKSRGGESAATLPVPSRKSGLPVAPQPAAPTQPAQTPNTGHNALQRLGFLCGMATVFVKITVLSELLVTFIHINTYLLWIVNPPALFGTLLTGGIGRTLKSRPARLFFGFFCCMLISLPFSSWIGGSVTEFRAYFQNSFSMLFILGGLILVWSELRTAFLVIGAAGAFIIAAARFLAVNGESGRLEMNSTTGTIGNENDLASHIIFVLPFVLFIALDARIGRAIRFFMVVPMVLGLWVIFGTASRGALISLGMCFLFVLFRGSTRQRMAALIVGAVMVLSVPILLRGNAMDRLGSLFGGEHEEAKESEEARSYLLKQSLIYTVQHPVFGVGMSQFPNYEGRVSLAAGTTGNWHETHNAFTQISSECGVPAFIFFVLAIGSALVSVNRIYGQARRAGYIEIANASFCYLLSMVGYLTSIVFLSNAYRYYLPLMLGLAVALTTTAKQEMARARPVTLVPGWMPPIAARRPVARL